MHRLYEKNELNTVRLCTECLFYKRVFVISPNQSHFSSEFGRMELSNLSFYLPNEKISISILCHHICLSPNTNDNEHEEIILRLKRNRLMPS